MLQKTLKRLVLATAVFYFPAYAEGLNYQLVDLQASAQREVANDTVAADLYVELNNADPKVLAAELNRRLEDAARLAKAYAGVKIKTLGQQTFPIYNDKNRLQGWRGRADWRIESEDFPAATQLLGKLLAQMQLSSLNFYVSDAKRTQVENDLYAEAVLQFRKRADIVSKAFAVNAAYKLVNVHFQTEGDAPMINRRMLAKAEMLAESAAPAVASPGESTVKIGISGTIQLNN